MTSPLLRSPVGVHPPHRAHKVSSLPPPRGKRIKRWFDEATAPLLGFEVRRLVWPLARALPDFHYATLRARLLSLAGCEVRGGVGVLGFVHVTGGGPAKNLRVGAGSLIAPDAVFCVDAPITLGKNVSIGPRALLYTASHPVGNADRRMLFAIDARPIVVEDGAWIGLGAIVLPGVRIGRGAVVSAGAVVDVDVPANVLVAGNPATVVRELPP